MGYGGIPELRTDYGPDPNLLMMVMKQRAENQDREAVGNALAQVQPDGSGIPQNAIAGLARRNPDAAVKLMQMNALGQEKQAAHNKEFMGETRSAIDWLINKNDEKTRPEAYKNTISFMQQRYPDQFRRVASLLPPVWDESNIPKLKAWLEMGTTPEQRRAAEESKLKADESKLKANTPTYHPVVSGDEQITLEQYPGGPGTPKFKGPRKEMTPGEQAKDTATVDLIGGKEMPDETQKIIGAHIPEKTIKPEDVWAAKKSEAIVLKHSLDSISAKYRKGLSSDLVDALAALAPGKSLDEGLITKSKETLLGEIRKAKKDQNHPSYADAADDEAAATNIYARLKNLSKVEAPITSSTGPATQGKTTYIKRGVGADGSPWGVNSKTGAWEQIR